MFNPNYPAIFVIYVFLLLLSCSPNQGNKSISIVSDSLAKEKEWIPPQYWHLNADFGYRFSIRGDFDGDGKMERLNERYFSMLENRETPKSYEVNTYEELVDIAMHKNPISYLACDNPAIDSLFICQSGQLFGLSFLKNEGDITGDGSDEISFVVDWADWSSLNTCHVMSFQKGSWKEVYAFSIWDWQLPDLPGTQTQYGLFGTLDKKLSPQDSTSMQGLKELWAFPGLIRKTGKNKIQVWLRNEEGEEELRNVDLNHPR